MGTEAEDTPNISTKFTRQWWGFCWGWNSLVHLYHPVVWNFAVVLSSLGTVKIKYMGRYSELQIVQRYGSERHQVIDFQMPVNRDIKEN